MSTTTSSDTPKPGAFRLFCAWGILDLTTREGAIEAAKRERCNEIHILAGGMWVTGPIGERFFIDAQTVGKIHVPAV